jgi:peptidoglycan-N-acetylglucosamine deacetylase
MHTDRRVMTAMVSLLAGSAAVSFASCKGQGDPAKPRVCSEGQALVAEQYRGAGLPEKTLALTFDDGPGARTVELSHYLKERNIPAAFFVNGRNLEEGVADLRELVADGHVIGNHTQTHPDLTKLKPAQIVAELEQTDELIAELIPDQRFMFRPPFGAYTEATFLALQSSSMNKYVGPIQWDMGDRMGPAQAADWDCWGENGISQPKVLDVETCGDLYLAEIRAKESGIVLMHDPYFIGHDPTKGGTVDMVKYIVPILESEGFKFVRVDMVPEIAAALPPLPPAPAPPAGRAPTAADAASPSRAADTPSDQGATTTSDSTDPCPPSPQRFVTKSAERGRR